MTAPLVTRGGQDLPNESSRANLRVQRGFRVEATQRKERIDDSVHGEPLATSPPRSNFSHACTTHIDIDFLITKKPVQHQSQYPYPFEAEARPFTDMKFTH
ncbi:hypothetical protein [Burkholderia pseudomultivorans]|uniref:hypothetical protein n=1 Tax=Burkholderia pseudomultivorans TaxID=1207504 RepID=UPI00158DCA7F|nr:hypothetical protein [Burkholderia pseudomultivorans]